VSARSITDAQKKIKAEPRERSSKSTHYWLTNAPVCSAFSVIPSSKQLKCQLKYEYYFYFVGFVDSNTKRYLKLSTESRHAGRGAMIKLLLPAAGGVSNAAQSPP
jgi:hypothetical protein